MPDDPSTTAEADRAGRTSPFKLFCIFLGLGLTSFGGPVAHLAYYREAFVVRRRWLTEQAYADLVALCQFLPGPGSSQVAMAIGLMRGGYLGMILTWVAFSLPSTCLMIALAFSADSIKAAIGSGWILGLKAAAVAVVAHAVLGMAKTLTPDKERATIAVGGMIATLLIPIAYGQLLVILLGGLVGLIWLKPIEGQQATPATWAVQVSRATAGACLLILALLLVSLPVIAAGSESVTVQLFDGFFRTGALVFGGGHVILPLLQAEVVEPGFVDRTTFLTGYSAAQAMPGPLSSVAGYLGVVAEKPPYQLLCGISAMVAFYLPSILIVVG